MIPSLRRVEDIPDWGVLVELVGGEHNGANVLLVPAARVLPRARVHEDSRLPRRRPVQLTHDRFGDREESHKAGANRRAEALLVSLLHPRKPILSGSARPFKYVRETGWGSVGF